MKQDIQNSTTASVIESHINFHSTSANYMAKSSLVGASLFKSVDRTSKQLRMQYAGMDGNRLMSAANRSAAYFFSPTNKVVVKDTTNNIGFSDFRDQVNCTPISNALNNIVLKG